MPRSGVNNLSVVKGLQELIGFEAFSSVGNEEAMLREIGVAQPSVDATEEVVHTSGAEMCPEVGVGKSGRGRVSEERAVTTQPGLIVNKWIQ